ncbi:unnamed protein product [Merluccius merluccius]
MILPPLVHTFLTPTRGSLAVQQEGGVVSVAVGANVTMRCFPRSDVVMHFSWYRQSFGGPSRLLSTIYKYEQEHTSAVHHVNGRPRFEVYRGDQGLNHLHISNVHCNDSAVYYCGSAHSNVVEFGDGVFLHVTVHTFLTPTQGSLAVQQEGGVVSVAVGANVTMRCFPRSDVVMHFSWYRQSFGGPPRLLSTIYKYEQEHTSAVHRVNGRPRFEVYRGNQGLNHLHISNVHCNDSAVYYCGSAHSNVVEFGDGVFLHVTGSEVKPQQFLNRERDAPRFWCNVHCRTRCTVDGDNPCQREDVSEKRSPFESVSDGQDCDQGGGSENLAAAMRVLVLLSIGRIVTVLLCVVVAALLRTLKSFS